MISRNGFDTTNMMDSEKSVVDYLYDICDVEFNSRFDVHQSFQSSAGEASWARYYVLHEVQEVATREGISASWFLSKMVADKIAKDWYIARAREEHESEY
jgi:hypothetical protein